MDKRANEIWEAQLQKEIDELADPYLQLHKNAEALEQSEFADPGGRSALRAGSRIYPCPTCNRPNQLTAEDKKRGYQCDRCADQAEGLIPNAEY